MPSFVYTAKNTGKEVVEGEIIALNQQSAVQKILEMGYTPVVVEPLGRRQGSALGVVQNRARVTHHISDQALVFFFRSLGDMLEAGVPLVQSLSLLSKQRISAVLKEMTGHVCSSVKEGMSLSKALEAYPQTFNKLYVSMIRSSEASGNVSRALISLSQNIEKDIVIKNRIRSALMYPMIILGVGVAAIVILLTFVLPKLSLMFEDVGTQLPWLTQVVVGLSGFLAHYGAWLLAAGFIGIFYIEKYRRTTDGHARFSRLALKLPIVGDFLKAVYTARFTRTVAVLLESGVPIAQALESSVGVLQNAVFEQQAMNIAHQVRMGASLSTAVRSAGVFGDLTANLISVGEHSGKLENNLYKIAAMQEDQSRQMTEDALNALGPVVLIAVVLLVGSMMLAIILPLIQMNMIIK